MSLPNLLITLRALIKRAVTTGAMRDTGSFPVAQVKYFNQTGMMEVLSPYGFCSSPPVGSLALLLAVNGRDENRAGIADLPAQRFKNLKPGEVAVGNYLTGAVVIFKANGDIDITGPADLNESIAQDWNVNVGGNVSITVTGDATLTVAGTTTVDCPTTHLTGTLHVDGQITGGGGGVFTGDITATGDILDRSGSNSDNMHGMRTIYNSHTHPDPQGGNTSAPSQPQ